MSKGYKSMVIDLPMFEVSVEFIYGNKQFKKFIKAHELDENDYMPLDGHIDYGKAFELVFTPSNGGETVYKIVLHITDDCPDFKKDRVLVHELNHTVTYIMNSCLIKDDEFRSYCLDYLYNVGIEWLMKEIKKESK